jgi:hypothetical protein
MDDIERKLKEVALYKAKKEALEGLISEGYREVEKLLAKEGLTKYTLGEGKEAITARVKSSSKMVLKSPQQLLSCISDPLQFARVILDTTTIPQKLVKALKELSIDISVFEKVEGKKFLEVTVGKESAVREAICTSRREYIEEVEKIRQSLAEVTLTKEEMCFFKRARVEVKPLVGEEAC